MSKITNIMIAGLGGQGVLKASDIVAEAAFEAGFDVKKSEVHGMSQRGGSVTSEIRYGADVASPMIPAGETDYMVVLDDTQIEDPTSSTVRLFRSRTTTANAGTLMPRCTLPPPKTVIACGWITTPQVSIPAPCSSWATAIPSRRNSPII